MPQPPGDHRLAVFAVVPELTEVAPAEEWRASCATAAGRPDLEVMSATHELSGHIDLVHETTESPLATVVISAAR